MSQDTIITIEEVPPHNGKPITKIAISPQSKYVVTYSQEDKSFVGWCSKNTRKEDSTAKFINIHSLIGLLFGNKDDQDHKNDDNNDYLGRLIVDNKVKQYNLDLDVSDYKVSDDKIIIYEDNDELAIIYDTKNEKQILLNSSLNTDYKYKFNFPCYKFTNFLTNGDLATYNIIESKGSKNPTISRKPVLLIYSLNTKDNIWECKYTYEFDNMNEIEISCGGITNDRLWTLSKNTIFILDLLTFQYRKIPLEIKEKVIDTKMIELKFFKSLMVISIKGIHYIYSDRMDFPIKIIEGSNLENSIKYNNLIKSFLETNDNPNFRLNDQNAFGIFYEKPWMVNMKKFDLEAYIINDNYIDSEEISDIKDSINENIFYNIGKHLLQHKMKMINSNENQNEYHMRLTNKGGEFILEAFINNSSQNRPLASYNIRGPNWKHIVVNHINILYNDTELHIYTFNIEFKKIELKLCYNLEFLKYAIKLYNSNKPDALEIDEIKEIAQPATNELKKQWILYATNQKYFLAYYGENLLKSAIKQHNIELIELIYNKILEHFKENPNNNIHLLSLLCKNMPYLNQYYSGFLSKYYNEMNLFADSSNSSMTYNNLQHLYSYHNELKISNNTFIYYFLRKFRSYNWNFLYPLRIFSKFFKSRIYLLVLFFSVIRFSFTFTHDTDIRLYCTLDVITIIILSFMKYWKSRPLLVLLLYTVIIALSFRNHGIIIILFFRKYWKSQTQLIFMICIAFIVNPKLANIMIVMNIFARKYPKAPFIYIVGILGLIIYVAIHSYNEIFTIIPVFIFAYFIKYFESFKFQLALLILLINGYALYLLSYFSILKTNILFGLFEVPFVFGISISVILFIICAFFIKFVFNERQTRPKLTFLVPFPGYMTYPKDYNFFEELFIKPQSSPFTKTQNNDLYKTWNGEVFINFKWRVFGRYYYAGIWILFIIYLACFTLASIPYDIFNDENRKKLFFLSIILGFIHLLFEVRQFIWSPIKWIFDIWNLFDLSAYLVPVLTSIYWINSYINEESTDYTNAISVSCLLLDIKFLLFFRAFESFGIYFAIIIGVAKRIISFLFIILIILFGFAHAFFILLKPKSEYDRDLNDLNNPWSLTKKYHQVTEDTNIDETAILIEEPSSNTNLFTNYPNSLLSMYLFLTGDRNSLSAWSPNDNPLMILLMIIFSFVIVLYLMNLFIGLLNMAIEADNNRASYLAQKVLILREIELFYLFPNQRRWKTWFPDIIYYYADVDKVVKVNEKQGLFQMKEITFKTTFGKDRLDLGLGKI
ncbi:hypothetical protein RhiirA5_424748 [Rhizophagus irregularis]|uniref:Ion transport domain-containing protein n=1 Tax=Rhizophagus irregularis TaxID=588596 RepID=A0A2N0P7Q4_9GLOM|nr:hypothetical protein RhiirA5_424748 [Rhizophagus irregularis]